MFDSDSDMKIVGMPEKNSDGIDTAVFLEETGNQHFNGNMAKAKALGSDIVSAFSYRDTPEKLNSLIEAAGIVKNETLLSQIRILSVFCAEYSLDGCLSSALLSGAAVSQMFDVIEELMPDFYEELSHSAAFSFYYLCVKKSGKLAYNIGCAFAEMCDEPKNSALINLGSEIFSDCIQLFKKAIQGYNFV